MNTGRGEVIMVALCSYLFPTTTIIIIIVIIIIIIDYHYHHRHIILYNKCFQLGLPCRPQLSRPAIIRQRPDDGNDGESDSDDGHGRRGRKRSSNKAAAAAAASASSRGQDVGTTISPAIMAVVVERLQPRAMIKPFMRAFIEVEREGFMVRDKVVKLL